jgi:hypothetical protein
MSALLLVLLLVGTTAAFLAVSINYLSPTNKLGADYGKLTADGFQALGNAFVKATSPSGATFATISPTNLITALPLPAAPVPIPLNLDGGVAARFIPLQDALGNPLASPNPASIPPNFLNTVPGAPPGYLWVYGQTASTYGIAPGNYYFCLTPRPGAPNPTNLTLAEVAKAMLHAQSHFGNDPATHLPFVVLTHGGCGNLSGSGSLLSAMLFVKPWQLTGNGV